MAVLNPELPQHRAEFNRLRRLQLRGIPVVLALLVIWVLLLAQLMEPAGDTFATLGIVPLGMYFVYVAYLEWRRVLIFRNDLRQRQRPPE